MLAIVIVLAVLLLILTFPLGVDAAHSPEQSYLKIKLGLFRLTLLPKKTKKKRKRKKAAPTEQPKDEPKKKRKPTREELFRLLNIALDALHRLQMHISVDYLRFHWIAAASDPYGAILQFGRVNAALGALRPLTNRVFRIREEAISTELDLSAEKPTLDTRIVISLQIWEILVIAACAGIALLRSRSKAKRAQRAAAVAAERS